MSADKIIRMANQIALFMESKPHDQALSGFANHINDYWEPRMRSQFLALIESGAEGFRPLVRDAASQIRRPAII